VSVALRVGLAGKRAGAFVAGLRSVPGVEVAALCELDPAALAAAAGRHEIPGRFRSYDEMLASGIDAVVVGTPMQLHVPHALAALAAGLHVLSEVTAGVTIDQCRQLVAAVRQSGRVYMLAENYCYSKPAMLVKEMARRGLFGELYYAEGAYLHDCHDIQYDAAGRPTWRVEWQVGRRGCTYGTHSLGPVLTWLDDRVATVSCRGSGVHTEPRHVQDDVTVMLCQLASGGLADVRLDMQSHRPHNMAHYVLQGTRGAYVSGRRPGEAGLVWIEGRSPAAAEWQPLDAYEAELLPEEWRQHGAAATEAGHGGGDFFVARAFARSVVDGTPAPIDVDRAMDFTLPGLISEQSIAAGGVPLAVPDSRDW
jgi:predicted dehydrogenase